MNIDYNAIIAGTAVLASLTAIYAIWAESRRSTYSLGVNLLFKMNDEFAQPEFKIKRKAAVKFLLKNESDFNTWTCIELDDILDFFQIIASLTYKGILDKNLVWEFYSYWFEFYYTCTKEYISFCNITSQGSWEDLEWLHKTLTRITVRDSRKSYSPPTPEEIIDFLSNYEGKIKVNEKRSTK
jgi:hypothetical protein